MSNPNAPVLSPRDVPIDVWPVGQQAPAAQRRGRYLPESRRHPAKMLPALARRAIEIYSAPGAFVLDPLSGIGTTGVEAVHLGRHYAGVELEAGYVEIQAANLRLAREQGVMGSGAAVRGDARELPALLREHRRLVEREWKTALPESWPQDSFDLVLTSPPYGPATEGGGIGSKGYEGRRGRDPGLALRRYSRDAHSRNPANLANAAGPDYLAQLGTVFAHCFALLKPGGFLVVAVRDYRDGGALVDLPGEIISLCLSAGFRLFQRNVAILGRVRDGEVIPRASFWHQLQTKQARAKGDPVLLIQHEDAIALRKPARPARRRADR